MYDHELVFDIFMNIGFAIEQIQKRFEPIKVSGDLPLFVTTQRFSSY